MPTAVPTDLPVPTTGTTLATPAPSRPAAVIEARSLEMVYGRGAGAVRALDGVDLDVHEGRFLAVMGPSGSGKSTLMHCLAGLDVPTRGAVFYGDHDITRLPDRALSRLRATRVGFVFQSFNLLPTLTGRQNIHLPLELAGRDVDGAWLDTLLERLGIADRVDRRPHELSGGEQQRVAIARALVTRPAAVFADEPTGALDSHASAAILSLLRSASTETGQTVVMVTHDPQAARYADRVVRLEDGRIVADGTPAAVLGSVTSGTGVAGGAR